MSESFESFFVQAQIYDENGELVPYDYPAPDGSEIRLLPYVGGGGLCHCILPEGGISKAVTHQTVDEIWYFISGVGQVWRKHGRRESVVDVNPGSSLSISFADHFQFRNTGNEPLCILIATIPRWPGLDEAVEVEGHWDQNYIVTNPDVDGVLAACVLLAAKKTIWASDPVHFANYSDLEHTLLNLIEKEHLEAVYVTDLNLQEIDFAVFEALIGKARVHLIDHHSLDQKLEKLIEASKGECERPDSGELACSAELAIRTMGLSSTGGPLAFVAAAGRADDFNDPEVSQEAHQFADMLGKALMPGSELGPAEIVERLSADLTEALHTDSPSPFPSPELESWLSTAAEPVVRKQQTARAALEVKAREIRSRHFGELKVGFARVPDILFGKPGVEAVQAACPDADVAAAFFDSGSCWVFPRGFPGGKPDLLPFLEAVGGGGRDGGGGFVFTGPTDDQNYSMRAEGFLALLEAYGDQLKFDHAALALGDM